MRLSREKLVHLSHLLVEGLEKSPEISLKGEKNEVRLQILEVLHEMMKLEEEMDQNARRKILTQKRDIPEGSRDWEVLYRKYYDEELSKNRRIR